MYKSITKDQSKLINKSKAYLQQLTSPKVNHSRRVTINQEVRRSLFQEYKRKDQEDHLAQKSIIQKDQPNLTKLKFIFFKRSIPITIYDATNFNHNAHKFQTNIFLLISLTFFLQFYFLQLFCF